MTHMQLSFCFSNSSGVNLVCVICGFWWVKNSVQYRRNRSLTRGEIDAYWRLKKRIEEDHLKAISGLSSSSQVYYFLWAGFFSFSPLLHGYSVSLLKEVPWSCHVCDRMARTRIMEWSFRDQAPYLQPLPRRGSWTWRLIKQVWSNLSRKMAGN